MDQFEYFFRYENDRPDVGFIGGMYQSLIDLVSEIKPKKVKLACKESDLPFDMRFFIETMNMFYELSGKYGTQKFNAVEFGLELGLWYWNYYNYLGQKYF